MKRVVQVPASGLSENKKLNYIPTTIILDWNSWWVLIEGLL